MLSRKLISITVVLCGLLFAAPLFSGEKIKGVYVLEPPEKLLPNIQRIAIMNFESAGQYSWHRAIFGQDFSDALVAKLGESERGIQDICIKEYSGLKKVFRKARGKSTCKESRPGKTYQQGTHTKIFTLIEREKFNALLREAGRSVEGTIDEATAIKLGKKLGVQAMVLGTLRYDFSKTNKRETRRKNKRDYTVNCKLRKFTIRVNAKIVSTETGEILGTVMKEDFVEDKDCADDTKVKGSIDEIIHNSIVKLSSEVANYFAPSYVLTDYKLARIKKPKRYVNRAKEAERFVRELKLEEAFCVYKKINDEDEYIPANLFNLGVLSEIAGNFEAAKYFFEDAQSIDDADDDRYGKRLRKMEKIISYMAELEKIGMKIEMQPLSPCDAMGKLTEGRIKIKGKRSERKPVYEEASENSTMVTQIPGGLTVTFTEKNGEWYSIKVKRTTGWIHGKNISAK